MKILGRCPRVVKKTLRKVIHREVWPRRNGREDLRWRRWLRRCISDPELKGRI